MDAATTHLLELQVNGRAVRLRTSVQTTLGELLRDQLGLRGTKIACNQAACGACTVLLDGQAVFACHTLAMHCRGARVETIEGLGSAKRLHPLQQAFVAHDAVQCGFCTPGMLMALKGALDAGALATRDGIAKAISGNLCRCGAYPHILEAASDVAARHQS
jgi:xanthine dehydrogenase YagT iron-sulfur-binding subunit